MDIFKKKIYVVFVIASTILFVLIVEQKMKKNITEQERIVNEFNIFLKGVLLKMDYDDHDASFCKLKVISVSENFDIRDNIFGGKIEIVNDTANLRLIYSSCLQINDTIIIGPQFSYVIKFSDEIILDLKNGIDKCYSSGRATHILTK